MKDLRKLQGRYIITDTQISYSTHQIKTDRHSRSHSESITILSMDTLPVTGKYSSGIQCDNDVSF